MWVKRLLNQVFERVWGYTPYPKVRSSYREQLIKEANRRHYIIHVPHDLSPGGVKAYAEIVEHPFSKPYKPSYKIQERFYQLNYEPCA